MNRLIGDSIEIAKPLDDNFLAVVSLKLLCKIDTELWVLIESLSLVLRVCFQCIVDDPVVVARNHFEIFIKNVCRRVLFPDFEKEVIVIS